MSVFGAPMTEIPSFFSQALQIIEDNPREGLFRRCGDKVEMENFIRQIDAGEEVTFTHKDVHNCCALVKQYIRGMPNKVFAPLDAWFEIGAISDKDERREAVKAALERMEPLNFDFVFPFFTLLYELFQNPTIRMGSRNLGIIFVPNFFGLMNREVSQNVIETLIEDYTYVFDAEERRGKLFFNNDFSVCTEYGLPDPGPHISLRDRYKAWLQATKNIGVYYKRRTGGPMFDIYSLLCEEVFINYLKQLVNDTKVISHTDEWRIKLYDNVIEAFAEELEFLIEQDRYLSKLKRIVNEGIDIMHAMIQLRPVGKFLWVKMGTRFDPNYHMIKNSSDGFGDNDEGLFVIRPLFPGFYSKSLVFVKCGVMVGTQEDLDVALAEEEEEEQEEEEEEEGSDSEEESESEDD